MCAVQPILILFSILSLFRYSIFLLSVTSGFHSSTLPFISWVRFSVNDALWKINVSNIKKSMCSLVRGNVKKNEIIRQSWYNYTFFLGGGGCSASHDMGKKLTYHQSKIFPLIPPSLLRAQSQLERLLWKPLDCRPKLVTAGFVVYATFLTITDIFI